MQNVTITVAVLFSTLVLFLPPAYALAAYIAALLWYPYYLTVSVGTMELLMGRMVVSVLLFRCLLDDNIRSKFVWCRLDTWVSLCTLACVIVGLIYFKYPLPERLEKELNSLSKYLLRRASYIASS